MISDCSTGNIGSSASDLSEPAKADHQLCEANSRALNATAKARSELPALIPFRLQPVADVAECLADRKPQPDPEKELALFITLPDDQKLNVTELFAAFQRVSARLKDLSVSRACEQVLAMDRFAKRPWTLKTFREKFDAYRKSNDWVSLVNRSKCDNRWKETTVGLADAFLDFVASQYLGRYARADAKRQAILALHRHWKTGRNQFGDEQVIPGYEVLPDGSPWKRRNRELLPEGWTYWNILRQIKAREKFSRAAQAMLHDSTAAAVEFLPQIARTREDMRFMEEITFDDVRFDYLILNEDTRQPEELWALIARDTATSMVLGFVLYPATERADGTVSHLGAKQMKELAGQLLETYPLPPYPVHWKVERGTATIALGVKAALGELFGNRIIVSYTKMLGGKSPVGYAEKRKGNSRGKASHESHNRLFHTQGSFIPGQTGNNYEVRPSDLNARCDEARQIAEGAQRLPEHLRGDVRYTLLTLPQARARVREFSIQQNERTDHKLENFEQLLEWFDPADGKMHPADSVPHPLPPGAKIVPRKEMPVERALKLIRQVSDWTPASPAIVVSFLEHSEKIVEVAKNGEIAFDHEGKRLTFVPAGVPLIPGQKVLAYFHAADPGFIHLTNGKGSVLGTWVRKGRVRSGDVTALEDAMRYTHAAKAAAETRARELAAPQIADLEALRAHNARLHEFTQVTDTPNATAGQIGTAVGAALTEVSGTIKRDSKRRSEKTDALKKFTGDMAELAEPPTAAGDQTAEDDFSAEGLL